MAAQSSSGAVFPLGLCLDDTGKTGRLFGSGMLAALDDISGGIFFEKEYHWRNSQVENILQAIYFFVHDNITGVSRTMSRRGI